MGSKGIVASTAGIGVLLQEGIGDTIRVSLTPEPGGDRTQEVIVAQEILQTMGLRAFTPMVIACPGCGRTTSTYFQELAQKIQGHIRHRMPEWRKQRAGVEDMTVAVMGCVVNGPGESKHANIGISLPGTGEHPVAPVYEDGAEDGDAQGRTHRRGVPGAGGALHRAHLRPSLRMTDRAAPGRAASGAQDLVSRQCAPCEGGVAPLTRAGGERTAGQLHPDWTLAGDAKSLKRSLKFKDFYRTMSFVNALAHIANIEDHHPDLEIGYNYCRITYSTHSIGGLSQTISSAPPRSIGFSRPGCPRSAGIPAHRPQVPARAMRARASARAVRPTAPRPAPRSRSISGLELENSRSSASRAVAASKFSLLRQRS